MKYVLIAALSIALALLFSSMIRKATGQPADPVEYYAEDWIVLDTKGKTVCKDPYIRLDVKIVQCISTEPVR